MDPEPTAGSPIMCSLEPGEINRRAAALLPGLARRATRCRPLDHGVRLEFAAGSDTIAAVLAAVDAERQCCRFLRFLITVEPDGGPISLDITGPPGTRDFLDALIEGDTIPPCADC